jgi:hypothetical protein
MSRKQTFIVTLEFADKITDDNDVMEIASNIARAIKNEANNGQGITTDFSDTYTTGVSVKPQFLDEVVTINIVE